MRAMTTSVYLSFSHDHDGGHDGGHVSRLAAHLAAAGVAARYDTRPMDESWWETYTKGQIAGSSAVIAVMSAEAQRSGWVARELEYARALGKPILTLGPGELPGPDLLERLRPAPVEASHDWPLAPTYQGKLSTAVGIETSGEACTPLLNENAVLPAEVTEIFTTAEDNQPSIKIHVTTGDGRSLGRYELQLEPAPRHVPQIHVTFRVERDGAFRLLAEDGAGQAVPVTLS